MEKIRITAKDAARIQNIISITQYEGERVVNARDLHEALEVQTPFHIWIHRRLEEYGFEENIDYFCTNSFKNSDSMGRGRPTDEYLLTFDTAQEMAMVEKTPKGREIRQFFIWCRRALKGITSTSYDGEILDGAFVSSQRNKNKLRIQEIGGGDNIVQSFQRSNFLLSGMTGRQIRQLAREKGVPSYLIEHSLQDAWRYDPESYYLAIGNSLYSDLIISGLSHTQADSIVKQMEPSLKILGEAVGKQNCLKEAKRLQKSIESKKVEQLELF